MRMWRAASGREALTSCRRSAAGRPKRPVERRAGRRGCGWRCRDTGLRARRSRASPRPPEPSPGPHRADPVRESNRACRRAWKSDGVDAVELARRPRYNGRRARASPLRPGRMTAFRLAATIARSRRGRRRRRRKCRCRRCAARSGSPRRRPRRRPRPGRQARAEIAAAIFAARARASCRESGSARLDGDHAAERFGAPQGRLRPADHLDPRRGRRRSSSLEPRFVAGGGIVEARCRRRTAGCGWPRRRGSGPASGVPRGAGTATETPGARRSRSGDEGQGRAPRCAARRSIVTDAGARLRPNRLAARR